MHRLDIIQSLINKINAQSYLEIGIGNGDVYPNIACKIKYGVDPSCKFPPTHSMTSNDFFTQNKEMFDVIFIDGLHHADQVELDIKNSLKVLKRGGFIVCHDINPTSQDMQQVPRIQRIWTGDCWKAWVKIRSTNPDLTMYTVDTDFGCGIIHEGSQDLLNLKGLDLTYQNLEKNRKEWLNLISIEEFKTI